MEQKKCPACGMNVADGDKTCRHCGHAIAVEPGDKNPLFGGKKTGTVVMALMTFLIVVQLIAIILMSSRGCTRSEEGDSTDPKARNGKYTHVISPEVPASLEFCGEKIDLDRIDMAERLDRELTTTVYNHGQTSIIIKRANRYFPMLSKLLKANKVPEDMLYLAVAESSLNFNSVSAANAVGIWQFMPATGKEYGLEINDEVDERYDPEKETIAACKFLKKAYSEYRNWSTVCASYNAGMGKISKELSEQQAGNSFDLKLVSETSRYVFRIMAYKIFFADPKKYGYRITSDQLYQPIECDEVEVSTGVESWPSWAKSHGVTYAQLRDANPWIRKTMLTNAEGKVYRVKVPKKESLSRSKAKKTVYNKTWVVD